MRNPIALVYTRLKNGNSQYLLAFPRGDFFEFRYDDAVAINKKFPDISLSKEVDFDMIAVSKYNIFDFAKRMKSGGMKVAMLKKVSPTRPGSYRISMILD